MKIYQKTIDIIYLECSSNPDISNLEDSQIYYFDFPNYKVDDLTKYVDIINKRKKDYVSGAE